LEVLKEKLTKFSEILPHLKLTKKCFWDKKFEKPNKNCNSYGLMEIWSNFNNSKIPNYKMVKVFK